MYWLIAAAIVVAFLVMMTLLAIFQRRIFVRSIIAPILATLYRKKVVGLEHIPKEGGALLICNHMTWIDGVLILWMLPRNARFVVYAGNFKGSFMEWLAGAFDTFLMSSSPKSIGRTLKEARQAVAAGDLVAIFPEGTLSRTGQIQGFKPGLMKIMKGNEAPIIPMYLHGMWGSVFSFSEGKFFWKWPKQFRRQLTLYVDKPQPTDTSLHHLRRTVQKMATDAMVEARQREMPILVRKVMRTWRRRGGRLQATDLISGDASGRDMLIRTLVLRRLLEREVLDSREEEPVVGILLPPSVAGVAANVAVAMDRRVSANLNYTVSSEVMNRCIETAGIKRVLTSKRFLDKLDLKDLDAELVILDDLKDKVTKWDKTISAFQALALPMWVLDRVLGLQNVDTDDLLTVIFTSGSTGTPKGVMLSNTNVAQNVIAIDQAVRLDTEDVVLGVLPFFHSFGYAITLWGAQTLGPAGVYHFNPLDSRQVAKLAKRHQATVLLGTPTFMRGYVRRIDKKFFQTLDICIVGAEKMPADLFDAFEDKFGVRPVEGYGATELAPLVSVNIPPSRSASSYQPDRVEGSVGRPMPGVSAKVVSIDDGHECGEDEDGMLFIAGANVMKGYMGQPELTQEVISEGWYRTGDIAHIDPDGFIHITGRVSRFSKIGGEMVPHIKVEETLNRICDQKAAELETQQAKPEKKSKDDSEDGAAVRLCVTAVPDEKKGERLIVLRTQECADLLDTDSMRQGLQEAGLPNLFIPSADSFITVDEIPLLGSGKLDLKGMKQLAEEVTATPA